MTYTQSASAAQRTSSHTLTSLKRWSVASRDLPAVSQIKTIHVYDFDNTLFLSPLPNPQLWNNATIGFLQAWESFANGGWWHDPNILSATGKGIEEEEPKGWNGWWNENILSLVRMSMDQKDALTVLLTGRGEANFAPLIKRMAASQKLEFDLIGLKPEVGPSSQQFPSTMVFKQNFLEDLMSTYDQAEEIRVYEDRPRHVKGFRDFFSSFNQRLQSENGQAPRKPFSFDVVAVTEGCTYLDPVTETAEVQRMINSHNLALRDPSLAKMKTRFSALKINRSVFYTGYLISQQDSQRIIDELLVPLLQQQGYADSRDLKYMANSILISPRPATPATLNQVGGKGKKVTWQVTGLGVFDHKVWAARVAPVPSTEPVHAENSPPSIVLACRKGTRPADANRIHNWQNVPAGKTLTFDTVVGEKVVLRVEEHNSHGGDMNNRQPYGGSKRRHPQERDDDVLFPQQPGHTHGYETVNQGQSHGYHPYHRPHDDTSRRGNHRGRGRGGGRGRGAGRGGRGRGRGGRDGPSNPHYRSLDDQGAGGYEGPYEKSGKGGGGFQMDY
ncbi:hypothetical protein N7539_009291 [Penicillium diatomitis]|uniref:Swiss Army Knife RNA repair protein HAD domain-containing protein n=1 Tax=Penicillium diatomitis TaxID=2819901 RepID=A0A9X0BJT4_9EURO|nr:uncharacterized protein N7539_009291 [Penicillium diatomitis]KAJ5469673.1 hypothetical protein N7539_009291 [Penicillium diatomitis]